MNNEENSLESEFLVYAAKVELKQHQKMTDSKIDLDSARLENELATVYLELATLKKELLAKNDEIDRLNQEVTKLKDKHGQGWKKVL